MVVKHLGKGPLGRSIKWENNIRTCLREMGCGDMNRIELAQDRVHLLVLLLAFCKLRVLLLRTCAGKVFSLKERTRRCHKNL